MADTGETVQTSVTCFQKNLTALRRRHGALASLVEAEPVATGVSRTIGRDGTPTFLVPGENGRRLWLGRSSMPSISANETLHGFVSDGRNVVLPGILTGLEPIVLLNKMPAHAALFVIEEDVLPLRLALELYDYAEALEAGRLVLILGRGDQVADGLVDYFDRHPGYELPPHLLPVPQVTESRVTVIRHLIESAGGRIAESMKKKLRAQVEARRAQRRTGKHNEPAVAVLTVDPRAATIEQVRRISRALGSLGWKADLCVPDRPEHCHLYARLSVVHAVRADLIVCVNSEPGAVVSHLPDDVAVACWYGPGASLPPASLVDQTRERCVRFACFAHDIKTTPATDGGDNRVVPLDPAADHVAFHPLDDAGERAAGAGVDVAIPFDLPSDDPAAFGVKLTSHIALWREVRTIVLQRADDCNDGDAGAILRAAEQRCGSTLREPQLRRDFEHLVRTQIVPATIARAARDAVVRTGVRVATWGANWGVKDGPKGDHRGPMPDGRTLNRVFNAATVVLVPRATPIGIQTALDALAAGAFVTVRAPHRPIEETYPTLAPLTDMLHLYRTRRELLGIVREAIDARSHGRDAVAGAREAVCSGHTVASRLEEIVKTVRLRGATSMAIGAAGSAG